MQGKNYFKKILQGLTESRIQYIILRDDNFFNSKKKSYEFDILIHKNDLAKVKSIFNKIPNSRQFKNNIDLTHPLLVRVIKDGIIMDFDFQIGGIAYCGSPVLKDKFLFNNIKKRNGLSYLNTEAEFLMLLVHGFVFKKKFKYFLKYKNVFLVLFRNAKRKIIQKEMKRMFGNEISRKIILNLEKGDLKKIFELQGRMRLHHILENPLRIIPVSISKAMRIRNYFKLDKIFYFINPFSWAPLISFIGSDGSGKSTLVNKTINYFDYFGVRNREISLGVFSSIKNPFRKKSKENTYSERVISSHSNKNSIEIIARAIMQIPSQIKVLYCRKRGIMVVSDRYPYDLINFYGASGILKSFIVTMFQRPTKCFYVKVSPKELAKRNNDLDIDAIRNVVSSIEKNKEVLSLIELKNENFEKSEEELKKYLSEVLKNV